MPFGLKNAAQAFQRLMDKVCQGLARVFVYLDDILVASEDRHQHLRDLTELFGRLEDHGLVIKRTKCVLGVSSIDFLGHHVNAKGIVPLPEKVRVIRDFPRPSTVRGLQEFLGMINFYHRFVPHVAEILVPMHTALAGRKRLASLVWTPEMENAFTASKNALADATLLIHPVEDAPTSLTVDASIVAICGVLEQRTNGVWRPLGFFSRKLQIPRETKYSTFDRELLAAHFAIRHFRYFLEGRHFTLYTDQDSLVPALRKTADSWTSRQQNQLSAISEYTTDVRHIAGKDNQVADALSRITIDAVELAQGVDYHAMALAQDSDDDIIHLRNDPATSLRLENVRLNSTTSLLCDTSTGVQRPVVPALFRRRVFDTVHGLSHPGIRTTRRLLTSKFVWPRIAADAASWARACVPCQQSKVNRHIHAPVANFRPPSRCFSHVHVDVVGPLPSSQGFTHLLTVVDRFTRWPEAIPVSDTSALSLAHALLQNWVSRFGTPEHITSDRGSQFTSILWSQLSILLGTELHHTTSYHPQANGMVEWFHRDMKAALRSRLNGPNWVDELLWVLLGLRTAPKEDLHTSAAEMVYGTPLTVPGDFVCPSDDPVAAAELLSNLRDEVLKLRPTPVLRHGTAVSHVPNNIMSTDYVFVRHDAHRGPLHRIYDGPYHVIERADKSFVLDIGGRFETVSIDRLKCAHADPVRPIVPAKPPRRGRPPRVRQPPQAQADAGRPIVPAKPWRRGRPPRVEQSSSTLH